MKKVLVVTFLIVFLLSTKLNACVVFIYHKIGDNSTPSTNVSKTLFFKQMAYLKKYNYNIISLKKLFNLLSSKSSLPPKCVVLTFDDGYKSIFTPIKKVIKLYHYPITVFIPTQAIQYRYPAYLTLKQIKELMHLGVDFQSHSFAHPRFTSPPKNLDRTKYLKWIETDLKKSIDFFKNYLGYKPYEFAIPYGDYNKTVIQAAKNVGFKIILTQDATPLGKNTPLYLIPREPILGRYWSAMAHFKEVLNEKYLAVKKRIPDIGKCDRKPKIIGGEILNINRYIKNSFYIYTSQTGYIKAKTKGNLVYIKPNFKFRKKLLRVGIKALTKNHKKAVILWMIQPTKVKNR
ncbi:polysaccharide deacetylase family protein [Hippea jasoniae]|uniref:polysaccharide deacetylase family protein n=1 Tax=Hippea jasoniae TaxID=944479 RepID=UPI00068C0F43|nr:polysaccharide deacetylase family protein [Hippea jasoniae]